MKPAAADAVSSADFPSAGTTPAASPIPAALLKLPPNPQRAATARQHAEQPHRQQ
ncbi:MAG UNVERIFIED_CONTAM: hypothetical protein LVR18_46415 [Planctomycetaceae bacterium]